MQRYVRLVCLFMGLGTLMVAGDHKWLRRASTAAACAASAFDVYSTSYALNQGAVEANPLVARNGQVRWGRASLIKIGICAGSWAVGELHLIDRGNPERSDRIVTTVQFGYTGVFAYTGTHNLRLGDRLQARPSYLVAE